MKPTFIEEMPHDLPSDAYAPPPPRAMFAYCALSLVVLVALGAFMLFRPDLHGAVNSSSPAEESHKLTTMWKITQLVPQQGSNSYRVFRSAQRPTSPDVDLIYFTDIDTGLRVVMSPPFLAEEILVTE